MDAIGHQKHVVAFLQAAGNFNSRSQQLGAMSSGGVFSRHEEIRLALRFFLSALHKHKQLGSAPDRQRVLYDFARYKGLRPVVERLSTPAIQPNPVKDK